MKFTPEYFYVCDEVVDGNKCTREHEISLSDKECADLANARLEQMLAEAPVIRGTLIGEAGFYQNCPHSVIFEHSITHTARLVDIKEIK